MVAATWAAGISAQIDLLEGPLGEAPPPWPTVTNSVQPSEHWSDALVDAPLPTNAWWFNVALGSGLANTLPYLVKCTSGGLEVCQPAIFGNAQYVGSAWVANWTLGAVGGVGTHEIVDHDALSVTVDWPAAGVSAPLVRGMAYASMHYTNATPRFSTVHALLSINGSAPGGAVTSDRFEVELNNGQTWIAYTSSPITLAPFGNALQANAPFTGWVRWAVVPSAEAESVLDAHADAVTVGGDVSATVDGDLATLAFDWEVESMGASAVPLHYALPHHRAVLVEEAMAEVAVTTIKGELQAVSGATWHLEEPLTTIGFESPGGIAPALVPAITAALEEDVDFPVTAGDTYFGGKQLAALGRLALIADELGEAASAAAVRGSLEAALTPWMAGTNSDPLRYDATWGGVVSNSGGSFNQGAYNDHHFHYGYFLYAAAALAKEDAGWLAEWGDEVDQILRNIANPSPADPHYTVARNKDWFVGHSWAQGLYEGGDGRNQESSSEAVNAWYGVYLWGVATGDERVRDLGRLLLAMELRSAHTYYQITSDSGIYPEPFASNKVVGVLWSNKVDYTTWFGGNIEFIHGIQMLPFTPISEELLRPEWITEEYPVVAEALDDPGRMAGWRGFCYMAHAVIDPVAAWWEADELTGYDDGNTRTNTLYWLATRPGAEAIVPEPVDPEVTFSVDLNGTPLLNGGVYLSGGNIDGWCGSCVPMNDPDGDGIYTATLTLAPGPHEYKFINGNWDGAEQFDPTVHGACTLTTDIFTNRLVEVPTGVATYEVPLVCFNSCEACPDAPCSSDTNGNGICDEDDVPGCTYAWSLNFNPDATMDDGSCLEPEGSVCDGDVTGDGMVSISDLLFVLSAFGNECP